MIADALIRYRPARQRLRPSAAQAQRAAPAPWRGPPRCLLYQPCAASLRWPSSGCSSAFAADQEPAHLQSLLDRFYLHFEPPSARAAADVVCCHELGLRREPVRYPRRRCRIGRGRTSPVPPATRQLITNHRYSSLRQGDYSPGIAGLTTCAPALSYLSKDAGLTGRRSGCDGSPPSGGPRDKKLPHPNYMPVFYVRATFILQ